MKITDAILTLNFGFGNDEKALDISHRIVGLTLTAVAIPLFCLLGCLKEYTFSTVNRRIYTLIQQDLHVIA